MSLNNADFRAEAGRAGCAQLRNYTAICREWGAGQPLVLVPGLAGGYELLEPLARILADRYRVITYQLRGEDDCFALRRHFGLADLVEDLAEFLEWHCLEQPVLVGLSFGGVLALEFAARHPSRLEKLVVQGVGTRLERGLVQRVASAALGEYPLPTDNPFFNQFFNLLIGARQPAGPIFEFVTRQCWQTDQSVMAHRFRLFEQFNLEGRLDRVRVPTLSLAGDRDLLVSEASQKALCRGIPRAEAVRLAGCGHLAFVTQPRRVAEEITRFVSG